MAHISVLRQQCHPSDRSGDYWTMQGGTLTITDPLDGVLVGDFDGNGQTFLENSSMSVVGVEQPPDGTGSVTVNSDGTFIFTAAPGSWGQTFFCYHVEADVTTETGTQHVVSALATVRINVDTMAIKLGPDPGGKDITGKTENFWAGELVGLNAAAKGPEVVPPELITNVQWQIPDTSVGAYTQTTTLGQSVPLTDGQKTARHIDVYWIDAGSKTVSVSATIGLQDRSASATIFIAKPAGTITADQDKVYLYKATGKDVVGLGNLSDNPETLGITFTRTPSPTPDGVTFFRQIAVPAVYGDNPDGTQYVYAGNLKALLDQHALGDALPDGTPIYRDALGTPNTSNDSPRVDLFQALADFGIEHVYGRVDFAMYVMWKSNKPSSIPVPLQRLDWYFSFDVSINPNTLLWDSTVPGTAPGQPATVDERLSGVDYTDLPEWTGNGADPSQRQWIRK